MAPLIYPAYTNLAEEALPDTPAFLFKGIVLTHTDIVQHLRAQSDAGVAYAQALVTQMLEIISGQNANPGETIAARIRVDVSPRECAIEQYRSMPQDAVAWKTMSGNWTVSQMITMLDARHPEGLSFISDMLRICRGIIARRSGHVDPSAQSLL